MVFCALDCGGFAFVLVNKMNNIPLVVADYVGKKYPHAIIHTIEKCVYMVGLGNVTMYIVIDTAQEKIVDIQVD